MCMCVCAVTSTIRVIRYNSCMFKYLKASIFINKFSQPNERNGGILHICSV